MPDHSCFTFSAMKCPNCGAQAQGKFCGECGTALDAGRCTSCNAKLTPGARFCTQCGKRTGVGGGNNAPWYVAGAGGLVLVVLILAPLLRGEQNQPPARAAAPMEATAPAGDPSGGMPALSGNMRENADRLFNRVMQARESGDTARAKFFVPMAVQAYQSSGELDTDGWYHLSVLQTFGGDPAGGRQSAEQVLKTSPNHILGLSAAATAALAQNDNAAARQYYQKIVSSFATERGKPLPEYQDHAQLLDDIQTEAKAFLSR
jgi:hypothetical protein